MIFSALRKIFIQKISLRGKIFAIAGSAVVSMVAIVSAYIILSADVEENVAREIEASNHLKTLAIARFEIESFTAAIDEIVARPAVEKLTTVAKSLQAIAVGSAVNSFEPEVSGLAQSLPEKGEIVFRRIFLNGLDEESGNIGALRSRAKIIEATLQAESDAGFYVDDILVDMLTLRRLEINFMLRGEAKFTELFNARVEIFSEKLARSYLSKEKSTLIRVQLSEYAKYFKRYVKGVARTQKALKSLDAQVVKIFAKIDAREIILATLRDEAAAAVIRQRNLLQISQLFLAIIGGALSVSMALIIGRSIERPITKLGQIMHRLSKGQLETEVIGTNRHDVIGEMARAVEVFKKNAVSLRMLLSSAESMANSDDLTGLPNRRSFYHQLDIALENAATSDGKFAVFSIDLDGFKTVNDVYGHSFGDGLLKQVGQRLRDISKQRCFVARLGGDEFSLIVTQNCERREIQGLAARISKILSDSYAINGTLIKISASIGVAFYPEAGRTSDEIFERADYALYKCKNSAEDPVIMFSNDLESEIANLGAVDLALQNCSFDKEMSMEFQPQYDISQQRVIGFEALARWNNPTLGKVRPDLFIAAAERIGVIEDLTEVLFRKSLEAAYNWPETILLSFNLSARDLNSKRAIAKIVNVLSESGVSASRIVFEVTETAMMADFSVAAKSIETLAALGTKIALDDFGTGYSSFGYINELPLDKIKIDKSFIDCLDSGEKSHKLVKTIIDMAENLGLSCVVEGVETTEQLKIVEKLGGRVIQGYIFGRPMPSHDVIKLLDDQARDTIVILPLHRAQQNKSSA